MRPSATGKDQERAPEVAPSSTGAAAFIMWPDAQNERGMCELSIEIKVCSLPNVLLAATAPVKNLRK
jgi:hypothetical protein